MPRWNRFTEKQLSRLTAGQKRRRVELFVNMLDLTSADRILDLGSEDGAYLATYYPYPENIVLADIVEAPMRRGVARFGLNGYLKLDVDGPIPVEDRRFDAVWCNSCIEHVTIERSELGNVSTPEFESRADAHQKAFADEIRRVANKYFVQTPYVHFPVEAHAWLPMIQYLPHRRRVKLSKILKNIWVKQWTADFHLYNRRRFCEHFPDATVMLVERFLGLPKSLLAIRA